MNKEVYEGMKKRMVCKHCRKNKLIRKFSQNILICKSCERSLKECNNKERTRRNKYLIYTYGITLYDYEEMINFQEGKCLICNRIETLVVDHNHKLSKEHPEFVRGLLCNQCNVGLGYFKDDVKVMKRAIDYLKA